MNDFIQENAFVESEADAWFERNSKSASSPMSHDHHIIRAIKKLILPGKGAFADLGGASGRVSAAISEVLPEWQGYVIEPSRKAVVHGENVFPHLRFQQGSITQAEDLPNYLFDLVIVSGVFTWLDRFLLSSAIANTDKIIKNGGILIVSDFDPPHPRANPYHHRDGLYTYKQDYSTPFLSLNTYNLVSRESMFMANHTSCDASDKYDTRWMTAVLQKDINGRYFKKY